MAKVNPKIDLVFKKLFGSEENKDILLSLVNAILPQHQQIAFLSLKNPYNLAAYTDGKLTILDIKAQDEFGIQYDIEMQIRGSDFYGKRTLYYWAKMFGSQLDYMTDTDDIANNDNDTGFLDLKKCIVISLMDFSFFDDTEYQRCFTLKNRETNQIHKDLDYLDLYFIEMKKLKKDLGFAQTILERWIKFLNNASKYTNDNLPQELAEIKEIKKANKKLEIMHFDKIEREHYEGQQKYRLDEVSRLQDAVHKKSTLIAKNLKDLNISPLDISKATGLSTAEIEKL